MWAQELPQVNVVNEASDPWGGVVTALIPVASAFVGAYLQRRFDRNQALRAARQDAYPKLLGAFRHAMAESAKAIQAKAEQDAHPDQHIDVAGFVRAAWDAGDAFGAAQDKGGLVASKRARRAAGAMHQLVLEQRGYEPLTDVSIRGAPDFSQVNRRAIAAAEAFEDAAAIDLGTRTWRERPPITWLVCWFGARAPAAR